MDRYKHLRWHIPPYLLPSSMPHLPHPHPTTPNSQVSCTQAASPGTDVGWLWVSRRRFSVVAGLSCPVYVTVVHVHRVGEGPGTLGRAVVVVVAGWRWEVRGRGLAGLPASSLKAAGRDVLVRRVAGDVRRWWWWRWQARVVLVAGVRLWRRWRWWWLLLLAGEMNIAVVVGPVT